ncbi:hypothetical protein HPB51_029220 [Rhipicephalus microplus]|uniref:Uncharacterized protein n=1 Tax=Rhipicephalus microplus TaxID=6941 RepID=A0A9J6CVH6_RHIMP|nr:hypothetical protein HPB51_029220 [Rhipicephalus microplus]
MTSPADQHVCSPKCAFCGGPHPTADRTCRQRFEIPYIVRQRKRERRDFDKDFPPIHHLSEPANKSRSLSRSSRGHSQYKSGPRSTSRFQSRSCSRSRGPAVSIQVPAATATEWADHVKGSQKQVTGAILPEQNNDRLIQLEMENAALKEAIAQLRVKIVALKNANNTKSEAPQPPQVSRLETPVETPKEMPVETPMEMAMETPVEKPAETPVETPMKVQCTVRPAKTRALTRPAFDEELHSFKTEITDMFQSLSQTVALVHVKVDTLADKFSALDAKVNTLDANFCALDAKVHELERRHLSFESNHGASALKSSGFGSGTVWG